MNNFLKNFMSLVFAMTIGISLFAVPLNGVYTINSALPTAGTNFATFNAASDSLTLNGVSGAVTFLVSQGTYVEQVVIGNIVGTSATNTVTFKANPANTGAARIEFNSATSVATNYVIQLSNANYIVVDSLEIASTTGATYGKLVDFIGINSHITFKNNTLYGSRNLSNSDNFSIFFENTGTTNVSNDLTFDNNTTIGGSNVFYINSSGTAHQSNFFITNNTIMYPSDYGVYTNESSNVQVIGNYIEDDSNRNTTLHAIYLTYSDSASDIRSNTININSGLGHCYGIRATYVYGTASNPVHIENNMVNMIGVSSTRLHYGIDVANCYYQNIYHNSIKVNSSSGLLGRPLYLSGVIAAGRGKTNIVNNIFYNNQGTSALYTTAVAAAYIDSIDYNIYYSAGSTPFKYDNVDYLNLAALQAASGKDRNSLFGDPGFASISDLHLVGTLANGAGDNFIGVAVDIDGDTRPFAGSTTVDIGADEYSLISCPPPSQISGVEIRHSSAEITWLNGPNDQSWIVEIGVLGFTPGSGTVTNSPNDTVTLTGLLPSTCYEVYLRSICPIDSSALVGPFVFCTPCAPFAVPFLEDFTTMSATAPPTCWIEGKGFLSSRTVVSEGFSSWTEDDFANTTSLGTGASRCVLGFTNINDWLVSPLIDLGGSSATNYQVEFKIAVTSSNSASGPTGGAIALDDKIAFLISTDYGTTWSEANILRQWDTTDLPVPTGEFFTYDLTAAGYTGVVRFAFYTQSTIANVSNEVHIDDFSVSAIPTCPDPRALVATGNTPSSISLAWTNGANDVSWVLEHGAVGFVPGSGTSTPITTSGLGTVSGLISGSLYDVYLRSICGAGDTSRYIGPLKIQTACVIQTDFCESFSNVVDTSILPVCWSRFNNSTVANAVVQVDYTNNEAHRGSGYLLMNNSTDIISSFMLISPEISNLSNGTHRADFWAKENGESGDSSLIIGTIASPTNLASFVGWDTINLTSVYSNHKIDFTTYTGTSNFIAFLWIPRSTNDRVFIDEFCWEVQPSCEKPALASILNANVDSTRLDLGWVADTAQSNYLVWYGPAGYTPGATGQLGDTSFTGNFISFTGLKPLTEYCFWVKSICTNGDTSGWEGPLCGSTGCPDGFKLPYSQDFGSYVPVCWEEKQGRLGVTNTVFSGGTTSNWASSAFGSTGSNAATSIQIVGTTIDEWLISPTIDLGANVRTQYIEFDYALTQTSTSSLGVLGVDDSLVFVASYDNGVTWSQANIIAQWDATSTIAAGTNRFSYTLRNHSGKVKFAFYAASTVSNAQSRFHIDNFSIKDSVFVGINENQANANFQVYPNPNQGLFSVLNQGETKSYLVKIIDIQGRTVYSQTTSFAANQASQIDISPFESGMYIMQFIGENHQEQHRIIKQ